MKIKLHHLCIALALFVGANRTAAQGTAFTYQGQLQNNGSPANGSFDLTFTLYNASSGGSEVAGPLTNSATGVTNGLFTTAMDFGPGVFTGASYWLQTGVRTNGANSFAALTPRQQVTPTPYAIYSSGAGAATTADTATTANGVSAGSITGAGIAAGQVVKTLNGLADDVTLAAGANVSITPSGNTLTVASTGGGGSGWSLTGNAGTTPGVDFLGTTDFEPLELWVNDARAFRLEPGNGDPNVIGGSGNSADPAVGAGTIAGGTQNSVSGGYPTVSGGEYNQATANGAVVGGGYDNKASAAQAMVGGGAQNMASGPGAFVGGGGYDGTSFSGNSATTPAATVSGGYQNAASGYYSTVGGGSLNTANGINSVVPGGYFNTASGAYSFAAGYEAEAIHSGTFVWADTNGSFFASTGNNQFDVRASGGVLFTSGSSSVSWSPGAASWSFTSDRNAKENFKSLNVKAVLDKVAKLPLMEWNYKGYDQRHVGPMAQDFHAAFPFNENDKMLNSADVAGVSLAAIQGLNQELNDKQAEIAELRGKVAKMDALEKQMNDLTAVVKSLTDRK